MPTTRRKMGPATVLLMGQLMVLLMVAVGGGDKYYNTNPNITAQKLYRGGMAVEAWHPCSGVSAWELGCLIESDMLDVDLIESGKMRVLPRNSTKKWENKTVPYFLDKGYLESPDTVRRIEGILDNLSNLTCIHFRNASSDDPDYLYITGNKEGCYVDGWGRKGGKQIVNLQPPGCTQSGTVYHIILHALGMYHLFNSPDRDEYITIDWKNVEKGKEPYFYKYRPGDILDYLFRYDYKSVMHASRKAFSKNGMDTIITSDPLVTIGQRNKPSYFDLQKIRKYYGCEFQPKS